jgi:hypothetical protein
VRCCRIGLTLLLLAMALVSCSWFTREERGAIKGHIVRAQGSYPIKGARISIEGTDIVAWSDTAGDFVVDGVPIGVHSAHARARWFHDAFKEDILVQAHDTSLVVFALQHILTGDIEGTVSDAETDVPLGFANVVVKGTGLGAFSKPDGRYLIRKVPVGTHTVVVRMMKYKRQEVDNIKVSQDQVTHLELKMVRDSTETLSE